MRLLLGLPSGTNRESSIRVSLVAFGVGLRGKPALKIAAAAGNLPPLTKPFYALPPMSSVRCLTDGH